MMPPDARPWCINTLASMIAPQSVMARLADGRWVRGVPLPYSPTLLERLRAAWWVLTGRAHAVVWPAEGDLERILGGRS